MKRKIPRDYLGFFFRPARDLRIRKMYTSNRSELDLEAIANRYHEMLDSGMFKNRAALARHYCITSMDNEGQPDMTALRNAGLIQQKIPAKIPATRIDYLALALGIVVDFRAGGSGESRS
jgi:hypothetical protein